jgi:hypothetical protein
VTIPGRGDLSPRRKHRDWRQRSAVIAVVLVVAAVGYGGYRLFGGGSSSAPTVQALCPSTTPQPPTAQQARLVVRNATLQTGLAAEVAHELKQRNFRIGKVGNTLFRGKDVATVQYSADRLQAAQLVAAQFDGATLTQVDGSRILEVDIGPKYRALVPVAAAQAAERSILGTSSPSPTATPSPTCAPRTARRTPNLD